MIYFLILLGVVGLLFACVAPFFLLKRFSPIPYFPSNAHDLEIIMEALQMRTDSTIFELGAGDGSVLFYAANHALNQGYDTQFIAYEINPYLLIVLHIRRYFHANKNHISIRRGDIFSTNYPLSTHPNAIFFTYISPWYMEKTVANLVRQLTKNDSTPWVSYFYEAPQSSLYRCRRLKHLRGVHDVYRYTIRSL